MVEAPVQTALRVLLVDDCPDTLASMALLLQLWGHQMPVCARCSGIYLGGAVAALIAPFRTTSVVSYGSPALGILLCAAPVLAAQYPPQPQAGGQQAAPSPKPAQQATPNAVDPGAAGPGSRSAEAQSTGTQQAAPSPTPAPEATPPAVKAKPDQAEKK